MSVRDVTQKSIRSLLALGLIYGFASCDKGPEPAAVRPKAKQVSTGVGGASAVAREVTAQPAATTGQPSAGAANSSLGSRYAVSLGNVSAFKVPTGKAVKVPYAGKLYDEQKQFDEVKSRFKPTAAQAYHVCASLAAPTKDFELSLYVNGARESALANARNGVAQGCRTMRLKKAAQLEIWVTQATDGVIEFAPHESSSWLTLEPLTESLALDSIEAFTPKAGEFAAVPFTTELYDIEKQFDAKTKRVTAAAAGDYRVCAALESTAGDFELDLAINGNRENGIAVSHQGLAAGCRTVRLAKGQFVGVLVHHESTKIPVSFVPKKFYNWLTVDKIPTSGVLADASLDNTSAFTVASGTPFKVLYVNKLYDDAGLFDLQTSRFKAQVPHDYHVCASATSLSKDFQLDIYINGTKEKSIATSVSGFATGCRTVRLNKSGDFLEVWASQSTLAPLPFDTNQFWNWMVVEPAHAL